MLHKIVKRLTVFAIVAVILWPFGIVGVSYLTWRLSDYPIGRDTAEVWNDGEIQLMRNYNNSSYSLYWKGAVICTNIQSYKTDNDLLVFISDTNQYMVDVKTGTISLTEKAQGTP